MNPGSKAATEEAACAAPLTAEAGRAQDGGISAPRQNAEQAAQAGCLAGEVLASPGALAPSGAADGAAWCCWQAVADACAGVNGVHARATVAAAACSGTAAISSRISHVLKSFSIAGKYSIGAIAVRNRPLARGGRQRLRHVHGPVRMTQQLLHGIAVFRIVGHADADGDLQLPTVTEV